MGGVLSGALIAAPAAPVAGQADAPPARRPASSDTLPLALPPHVERELPSGLRAVVVPDTTADATIWTLLVPGGSAADPEGREGTADLLAAMLQDAAGERPGTVLGVRASTDAMALTLVDSASTPGASARRIGDLLADAPLEGAALERARAERLEAARARAGHPDLAANRLLLAAVYGDHPYGRSATVETLDAVDLGDLRAWRDVHLRPDGAVLAVSGPVDPDDVLRAVRSGLDGWRADPAPPSRPDRAAIDPTAGGRRILVHRPGAARAVIHLGVDLPPPGDPDWTPLAVLDGVLTARRDQPLVTVRPPGAAEGVVAGTATAVQRRGGPGLFQARASVEVGVAAEVVRGLLAGLARAGRTFPSPSDVRPVQERLVETFRGQATSPPGAAALLAVNRVLGLPDSLMTSYPVRIRRIGPQQLREVAAERLDTSRVSVVVVADATLVRRDLEAMGAFELVDAGGELLAAGELEVVEERPALDASAFGPLTLEYRVTIQGQEVGTVTRTLEPGPDSLPGTMVFRSRASLGGQDVGQAVTFTVPGFAPVAARSTVSAPGAEAVVEVTVEDGVVRGRTAGGPGGARDIEIPLPDGALLGDMLELAAWLVPLEEGAAYRLTVVAPGEGRVEPVVLRVGPGEDVTVPAGTFRARPVETVGAEAQRYWIRVDAPRVPLRIEPAGRPVTLELVEIR